MAVNQEELAICRRRGHDFRAVNGPQWARCRWCGAWVRTVSRVEECDEQPPDSERDPTDVLEDRMRERLKGGKPEGCS